MDKESQYRQPGKKPPPGPSSSGQPPSIPPVDNSPEPDNWLSRLMQRWDQSKDLGQSFLSGWNNPSMFADFNKLRNRSPNDPSYRFDVRKLLTKYGPDAMKYFVRRR